MVAAKMFGEENDLADVMGIVSDLAIDGLHDGVGFAANRDGFREVSVGKRFERVKDPFPACVPLFHQLGACRCGRFEFRVAIAVGLFAVGGKKIAPAGAHVAGHVFHDDGDGIGFGIKRLEELCVGALRHGTFSERFVITENVERIFQIRIGASERHREEF